MSMAVKMMIFASMLAFVSAAPGANGTADAADANGTQALTSGLPPIPVGLVHQRQTQGQAEHMLQAALAAAQADANKGGFLASRSAKSSPDEEGPSAAGLSTTAAMEAAITDLMMGKGAVEGTPMGDSIKKIQSIITKNMIPQVINAHKTDQNMLNRLASDIGKCGRTKRSEFHSAKGAFSRYRSNSRLHKKCRSDEAVRYTSQGNCFKDQHMKYKIKVLKCKAFAAASLQYGTQKNNAEITKKGGGESVETYVKRLATTFCGKHVHGAKGQLSRRGGWGGGLEGGYLDKYLKAKEKCRSATTDYIQKVKECKKKKHAYNVRKAQCNLFQERMDQNSCKRAVLLKDACESYAGCYYARLKAYEISDKKVRWNERDRKAEWRGLKRMKCLIGSFADGKVTAAEVDTCKKQTHSTKLMDIKYPKIPKLSKCVVPTLYPSTGAYKRAEFAPLPMLARGKESHECSGVTEVSTTAAAGSPSTCKCTRVTLVGFYSPGALVKCENCRDTRRSEDQNSCPKGTKLFAPQSRGDWRTFLTSTKPLRAPNWIVDVTRPQNGCGGCTSNPMNSGNSRQKSWRTQDGGPWWLRSTRYSEPNGDYSANCYLDLWRTPRNSDNIEFNDGRCSYHSKSYYCQSVKMHLKPRSGSPASCKCTYVDTAGTYSAGALVKCEQCTTVYRSTQKNSCPIGTKLFAPRTRADWRTFLKSAGPLRAPHWIIDITRPQNGCGGCTRYPMRSKTPQQATWRTSDRSPWWLRDSRYNEPNGDYSANCYMDLWRTPASENNIQFNDGRCNYRSRSYYCQPDVSLAKKKVSRASKEYKEAVRRVHSKDTMGPGFVETVYYFGQGRRCPSFRGRRATLIRKVDTINYPNTGGSFRGLSRRDNFAMSWIGYVIVEKAGMYKFKLRSDDGSKLSIDGKLLVNNDGLHGARNKYGKRKLIKGQHNFHAVMFEKGGHAAMQVTYVGPDTGKRWKYVPGEHYMTKGFKEQVYYMKGMKRVPNLETRKPDAMRIVSKVWYKNTGGTWPGFRRGNDFAVKWTGFLHLSATGRYRFSLLSDDGSKLHVNGKLTVNNDGLHGWRNREGDYRFKKNKNFIRLEYFERGGHAGMLLRYMGTDTKNRMITVPSHVMRVNYMPIIDESKPFSWKELGKELTLD